MPERRQQQHASAQAIQRQEIAQTATNPWNKTKRYEPNNSAHTVSILYISRRSYSWI